jgi:hypothetical protein
VSHKTFSNRKREAASKVVYCQLHRSPVSSHLLPAFQIATDKKAFKMNMIIRDSPEKRIVSFKNIETLILHVAV